MSKRHKRKHNQNNGGTQSPAVNVSVPELPAAAGGELDQLTASLGGDQAAAAEADDDGDIQVAIEANDAARAEIGLNAAVCENIEKTFTTYYDNSPDDTIPAEEAAGWLKKWITAELHKESIVEAKVENSEDGYLERITFVVKSVTPKTPSPKSVEVQPAAPKVKVVTVRRPCVMPRETVRSVKLVQNASSDDPAKHTPAGRALIKKFDEYDALCAKAGPRDEALQLKCAYKLYDIMLTCCPRYGNPNESVYRELIAIVFKRLCLGYGTKYSDATLFRMDYRLPTPSDSMKFDTFWNVMYQLVEAATIGTRVNFNNDHVSKILKSSSAMVEIIRLRKAVEASKR